MRQIFNNFFTTLRRYRLSSLLNISGLSIAFVALYFLTAQVRYDLTYNDAIENSENLYLVTVPSFGDTTKFMTYTPRVLMEEVAKSTPLIERVASVPPSFRTIKFSTQRKGEKEILSLEGSYGGVHSAMFDMLGYKVIDGSLANFDNPVPSSSAVISHSAALTYNLKVGDELAMVDSNGSNIIVEAIFEDREANTSFSSLDIITNIGEDKNPSIYALLNTYIVKAAPGVTCAQLNNEASEDIHKTLMTRFQGSSKFKAKLRTAYIPLSELYFNESLDDDTHACGDISYTLMLIAIALIIIVIALMNFINFFFALIPVRIHTINICKVYGSSTRVLRINFIFETLFMILLALILSLGVIYIACQENIGKFFTTPVAISDNWSVIAIMALFALPVAILVSLYPSYKITSYPATLTLKGNFGVSKQGRRLRYGLLALQLIVTITLISVVLFFNLQLSYIKSKDLGFNTENMLILNVDYSLSYKAVNRTLSDKILSIGGVKDFTYSSQELVSSNFRHHEQDINGINDNVNVIYVAPDFMEFMGIEITQGRNLLATDGEKDAGDNSRTKAIFNEAGAAKFGVTLTDDLIEGISFEVVGVCSNINNFTLEEGIEPMAYVGIGSDAALASTNYIRYEDGADIEAIVSEIREIVCQLDPNESLGGVKIRKFEEYVEYLYNAESDLVDKVAIFTLISIVLSMMGLFGLVYFDIQYKRHEIAIRRVMGASTTSILKQVNKRYIAITVGCFLVAAPIGYYIVDSYLSTFAYRTPIYLWLFVVVLLIIMTLIVLIITTSSYRTANINPTITLK